MRFSLMILIAPVLAGAIALGGGNQPGAFADWLVILASVPLLAAAAFLSLRREDRRQRLALLLVVVSLALPVAQVIPWPELPASLRSVHTAWQVDWVQVFGQERLRTWSLVPDATIRTLFAFVPPLAMFLAVLNLDARSRIALHRLLVVMVVACATLGILQSMLGPKTLPGWHSSPVGDQARGFFSNRNHFALLMVFGIALAGSGLINAIRRMLRDVQMPAHGPVVIAWAMALLLPLVAIMLSGSRAGVILGALLLIALLAITLFGIAKDTAGTRRWFSGFAAFACVVAIQMGLWGVLERFQADPFDDARVFVQQIALKAANEAQPWGTGLGSFRRVYEQHETLENVLNLYVNRAHNDWIEFYLEAGVAGLALIGLWGLWWIWARRVGGDPPMDRSGQEQRLLSIACTLALAALAIHSLVDYPMRTISIATVAAALLAMSVPPVAAADRVATVAAPSTSRRRVRTRNRPTVANEP